MSGQQLLMSRQKLPVCCPRMKIKIKKLYSHKLIKLQEPGSMSWGKEKMVFNIVCERKYRYSSCFTMKNQ